MYMFRSGFYTPSQQPLTLNCSLQIILYSESQSQTSPVNVLTYNQKKTYEFKVQIYVYLLGFVQYV